MYQNKGMFSKPVGLIDTETYSNLIENNEQKCSLLLPILMGVFICSLSIITVTYIVRQCSIKNNNK